MCLCPAGDACVVGALERVGDTLHGARVYVELGRRLAHAHAARQGRPDTLSHLIRDRRTAKSLTFTLGPFRQRRPASETSASTYSSSGPGAGIFLVHLERMRARA